MIRHKQIAYSKLSSLHKYKRKLFPSCKAWPLKALLHKILYPKLWTPYYFNLLAYNSANAQSSFMAPLSDQHRVLYTLFGLIASYSLYPEWQFWSPVNALHLLFNAFLVLSIIFDYYQKPANFDALWQPEMSTFDAGYLESCITWSFVSCMDLDWGHFDCRIFWL